MSTKYLLAVLGGLCLASPSLSEENDAKGKAGQKPRIIQVDLDKLSPELARQLLAELSKGGKDHSRDWHRPYDFSQMPPGIADKMFGLLPPGIAKKVLVQDRKERRYDWSRMPPGIADRTFAQLPPGIAKKVLGQDKGKAQRPQKGQGDGGQAGRPPAPPE